LGYCLSRLAILVYNSFCYADMPLTLDPSFL
jgi:hypothetical protein